MDQRLNIRYVSTATLMPYAGNPRTHSKTQIEQIARSIQAFGFINPLLIDESGQLVAGHGRLLAARELGLVTVPCIRIEHLTEAEKRAYLLADNKLAENAGWNPALLRVELDYLLQVDVDIDVELTGFSMPEIDNLLKVGVMPEDEETPPPPLPPSGKVCTRPGDLWQLGPHRLLCGDCREPAVIRRLMGEAKARMCFTDPPYNVPIDGHARGLGKIRHPDFAMASGELSPEAFTEFLQTSLGQLASASLAGALHYVCMDWRHLKELLGAGEAVYSRLINLCVWNKSNGGMGSLYRSKHELILVFKAGQGPHLNHVELGRHGRYRTNVWDYPGVNAFGGDRDEALALHPTVKPVRMIADAILDASRRGDIVLDGFAGAGSTLLAAERTGRIFHGVEIDPRYVDVTLRRWQAATGEQAIHADSGQPFDDRRAMEADAEDVAGPVQAAGVED